LVPKNIDESSWQLETELDKFCLDSSGRGRLSFQQSRQVFTYDSRFSASSRSWKFALFFPLQEELSLMMTWAPEATTPAQIRGPLARRIENELMMQDRTHHREAWDFFSRGVGDFLRILEDQGRSCKRQGDSYNCGPEMTVSRDSEGLVFTLDKNDKFRFSGQVHRSSNEAYQGLSLLLWPASGRVHDSAVLGIELFIRECDSIASGHQVYIEM
jgi:hypothetical protein